MQRSFKFRLISNLSIALGVLLIIVIVLGYLGFDISKKADSISETQANLLKRVINITNLTKLKEQERVADAALFKLNNALPKRDSLFSVSRDLGDMAKNRSLSFASKFGEEIAAKDGKPGFIRLEMNVAGSYDNLVGFVRDIEVSNYFINLLNFDIIRQSGRFSGLLNGGVFFND